MNELWSIEQLEAEIDTGKRVGKQTIVAEFLDVGGSPGELATLYFHLEGPGNFDDAASFHFTFNEFLSLEENFESLREGVEAVRRIEPWGEALSVNV